MVACCSCGFIYLNNPPEYEALEQDFAFEKTFEVESARRVEAEPMFSALSKFMIFLKKHLLNRDKPLYLLSKYAKSGDQVLDVGCGGGRKLAVAAERLQQEKGISIVPIGVDISVASAQQANAYLAPLGGKCIQNNAIGGLQSLPESSVDCVQMRAFLEHETNPAGLLSEAFRVLKPGGVTIIKVPNFGCINRRVRQGRWCGFRYPDHVNYFTPASLRGLLVQSGFRIRRMNWLDRFPLNDNMYVVAIKD